MDARPYCKSVFLLDLSVLLLPDDVSVLVVSDALGVLLRFSLCVKALQCLLNVLLN